jgi:hypothetical protein
VDGIEMMSRKPVVRVTKWLGDIPVEAQCKFCPQVVFRAQASSHRPNREEYQQSLQRQFDEHCRAVHSADRDSPLIHTEGE